jgi:pimeloyl-ACP methyl ester carboxylesterase
VTTFALVHGAWHGAWCWELLVGELERRGHGAIAVDLPCEDAAAGCPEYAAIVHEQLPAGDPEVVLVGHSLGGLTIPLVAAERPVRALVFLCALLPVPGVGLPAQLDDDPAIFVPGFGSSIERDAAGNSFWPDADAARATLYADCPRVLAEAALSRLRHQSRRPSVDPCPLAEWPDVESISVLCRADAVISPAWSRRAARDRLGVEARELEGGHSPFLSRPAELADLLVAATA